LSQTLEIARLFGIQHASSSLPTTPACTTTSAHRRLRVEGARLLAYTIDGRERQALVIVLIVALLLITPWSLPWRQLVPASPSRMATQQRPRGDGGTDGLATEITAMRNASLRRPALRSHRRTRRDELPRATQWS